MTMVSWIEYPLDPKELLLAWQAPRSSQDRLRWAVGRLRKTDDEGIFDYLEKEDFASLNQGRSTGDLKAAGFTGYPAFDIQKRPAGGFRGQALQAFLRRLPPGKRADFANYLAHHHLKPPVPLPPFTLLAVTEARLPSDGFSLVDPLDANASHVDFVFEVAGVGYRSQEALNVAAETPLTLESEPANSRDPHAIQVKADGNVIGYVNRLQARTIGEWLKHRHVMCWAVRVTHSSAERRIYAFLRIRPLEKAIAA